MGTPEFAVPCLEKLIANGVRVAAVVTGADKPVGRGQKVQRTPVKVFAEEAGLPILQPDNLNDPTLRDVLQRYDADLFVVVALRILPAPIFTIPPLGTINVHASLLPKYRGAAPIQWAILRGEKETGITTFFINEKMDSGEMILQRRTPIGDMETAGELHDRLKIIGAEALVDTVKLIAAGTLKLHKQEGTPTLAPKISKEMARIDWAQPSGEIVNLVRAMNPVPCAFSMLHDKMVRIYRVHEIRESTGSAASGSSESGGVGGGDRESQNKTVGVIVRADAARGELWVSTASGIIAIDELQLEGRKRLTAAEFLRGYALASEEKFA